MKVIYIANDGKQFDDEWVCIEYEWWLEHPHIQSIMFFDKDNQVMAGSMDEKIYDESMKVIVPNEDALHDLHDLANYCGWCQFESDITSAGTWIWDFDTTTFVKQ